ncbi:hypothetical protein ACQKM9_15705 [Viridibacillus sp. NPDC093762]|uniref:hypothetical protein n=1 Tax=Viridibacillus sp. NPDC093762 TaxID=3390720 RepID=UPI003CFDBB75
MKSVWLLLGVLTLFLKSSFDRTVQQNEGVSHVNAAIPFTNHLIVRDDLFWLAFSLFGALFVTHHLREKAVLYPFFAGRVTSRIHIIKREIIDIYLWTSLYVIVGILATSWMGSFTKGTFFTYIYVWLAQCLIVILLVILENRHEHAFFIWIFVLLLSTVKILSPYAPWMYGQAYLFFAKGNGLLETGILVALSIIEISLYVTTRKRSSWL